MEYYNNRKYYFKRAMKVAKKAKNIEAIELLKMFLRKGNIYPVDFIKEINSLKISKADLFNIEGANKWNIITIRSIILKEH